MRLSFYLRSCLFPEIDLECSCQAAFGKQIWPIIHALKFIIYVLTLLFFFNLYSILEAQLVQILEGVLFSHHLIECLLQYSNYRH